MHIYFLLALAGLCLLACGEKPKRGGCGCTCDPVASLPSIAALDDGSVDNDDDVIPGESEDDDSDDGAGDEPLGDINPNNDTNEGPETGVPSQDPPAVEVEEETTVEGNSEQDEEFIED